MAACYLDPPNQPMNRQFIFPQEPILYKDLIFIDLDSNSKRLLVGTTDATASFWTGALQIFNNFHDYETGNFTSYYNSSIIFDAKFFSSDRIILSESDFVLKVLQQSGEGAIEYLDSAEHYDTIKKIRFWPGDDTRILTSSAQCVTIWDAATIGLKSIDNFKNHHTLGVDTSKKNNHLFVTSGRDGNVLLWDLRNSKPSMRIYNNEFCGVTSIACSLAEENHVVVGSQHGKLHMLDIRQPNSFFAVQHCVQKPITHLAFNADNNIAVVSETSELHVYNCNGNQIQLVHKDSSADGKLMDAKWLTTSELLSCGLNGKVVRHSVIPDSSL